MSFILFLLCLYVYEVKKKNSLKTNYITTYGTILAYKDAGWRSTGGTFYYYFKVGDSIIREQKAEPGIRSKYSDILIGKVFPVVYFPDDVTVNEILITPKSFELMNLPFPDSLNWVKQYQ